MPKARLFAALAIGLLALISWRAYSHFHAPVEQQAPTRMWRCPMRCLNKTYDHPGKCPVCHMDLIPFELPKAAIIGYKCPLHYSQKIFDKPGRCPFCSLALKPVYSESGQPAPETPARHLSLWEDIHGKTAIYFRPYTVQKMQADRIVRAAGRLSEDGNSLKLHLAAAERRGILPGASAMIEPASGYGRPLFGSVASLGPGDLCLLRLPHPLKGFDYALAEIRVSAQPALAVPQEALSEDGSQARVFVLGPEGYAPQSVKVLSRGESFVALSGLKQGDVVAASGIFWLEAQWRMDHALKTN